MVTLSQRLAEIRSKLGQNGAGVMAEVAWKVVERAACDAAGRYRLRRRSGKVEMSMWVAHDAEMWLRGSVFDGGLTCEDCLEGAGLRWDFGHELADLAKQERRAVWGSSVDVMPS